MLPKAAEEGVNVSITTPPFPDMVGYLYERANKLFRSGDCFATAVGKLPFSPAILTEALAFLRLCLEESAGVSEEERLTGKTLPPVRAYLLRLATSGQPGGGCVDMYLELLLQSLGPAGGT